MMGVSGMISDGGGGESGGGGGGGAASGGSSGGGFMTEEDKAIRSMEEGERNSGGGNRWPRQETIALLQIRSEMDVVFRDSSLKGPLWEEVSRKMADLGYHRSAKKCKEKFENVFKYHKRTKDGRASKADGKTYRFFEQLEALENTSSHQHSLMPPSNSRPPPPPLEATPINMAMPMQTSNVQLPISQGTTITTTIHHVTVSSAPPPPPNNLFAPSHHHQNVPSIPPSSQPSPQPAVNPIITNNNNPHQVNAANLPSHQNISAMSYSTSSSTSSDEDIPRGHKKRKWKDFFQQLTKDVIDKQEELQRKFLEMLEKRERDRMVREEAWKVQEMARMNREHDLLVQERSMAAAKDAAVISFLQKITEQHNIQIPNSINVAPLSAQVQIKLPENPPPPAPINSSQPQQQTQLNVLSSPPPPAQPSPAPVPVSLPITVPAPVPALVQTSLPLTVSVPAKNMELVQKSDNGGESYSTTPASSSRWPKTEVEALIKLRKNLDVKYQENGPKGPLWEEISAEMRKIGYNRNAKRCKEKWENINKYFKKVKESNKKRPEDSKTCPYFHQLDALYKEKAKNETTSSSSFNLSGSSGFAALNPENNPMAPIMARPEQQWIPPHHQQQQQQQRHESTRMDHDHDHESDNMDEDDHDEDEDDDDDDENAYEMVVNKQQSSMAAGNTTTTSTTTNAATATTTV